jgi:hypothetical protein
MCLSAIGGFDSTPGLSATLTLRLFQGLSVIRPEIIGERNFLRQ